MILIVVCISQYICISQIMVSDEHLFVVFAGHLYIFFGEMSFKVFCPFFAGLFAFLILSCMNCLNVLEINPLSVVSVARNFFPHSEDCLFILFMVSFAVQKLLDIIRSHLFIFILFPLL